MRIQTFMKSQTVSHSPTDAGGQRYVWYRELTGYQWFALSTAALGWTFDCMAQQLFSIARKPAVHDLLGRGATDAEVSLQAGYSTMILMIGWAIGGVVFGILGDRLGRAKTMSLTILLFSIFTGMSFFAASLLEFNVYRFLCSLGVGGQFAVGVSLVAEVMPERARPYASGMLQALASVGNMTAGLVGIALGQMEQSGLDSGGVALHVPRGRRTCAAGTAGLQETERARTVAQSARSEEALGLVRRVAWRSALETELDCRHAAGGRGRSRPLGHRLLQLRPVASDS